MTYYNDNDPNSAAWLRELAANDLIAQGTIDDRSICDIRPSDLDGFQRCHFFAGIGGWEYALRLAGWPEGREVWTGSCPCQPFSAAGNGRGIEDERHLWPAFRWLIAQRRPATIFGEQVASSDGREWLAGVFDDLEAMDYRVSGADLCAAGVGAPHIRQRLYWLAYSYDGERWAGECGTEAGIGTAGIRGRGSSGSGTNGGLGDSNSERFQGRTQPDGEPLECGQPAPRRANIGGSGESGGLEHHPSNGRGEGRPESERRISTERRSQDGFWQYADYLYCTDDKWRPVEPSHVLLVDGIPGRVAGSVSPAISKGVSDAQATEESPEEAVSGMRQGDEQKAIQGGAGGSGSVQAEEVLRSPVHGGEHAGDNQGSVGSKQQKTVGEVSQRSVRNLRPRRYSTIGTSPRRESAEQQPRQLDDVVRLLPLSYSLAQFHGRWQDEKELLVLLCAIGEEANVQYPFEQVEAVWASLGEKAKNRLRMGFDAARWRIVVPFPLATGIPKRVAQLRGLGNAIVPQVAAEFIKAAMKVLT